MRKSMLVLFVILAVVAVPQMPVFADQSETDNPLSVSWGTVRTEAEKAAMRIAIEYADQVGERFIVHQDKAKGSGHLFDIWPTVTVLTGTEDAFNGIVAKMSGNVIYYKTQGDGSVDLDKSFHAIPIAFGIETNRRFDDLNALLEVGYVPFHLNEHSRYKLGLNPQLGVFLQAGYKFGLNGDGASTATGGAADQSEEKPDSGLLRLKAQAGGVFPLIAPKADSKMGLDLRPTVTGWYDIANSETYYRAVAILRLHLSDAKYFDFEWEKGSGAPNFNKGDQFSANVTVAF